VLANSGPPPEKQQRETNKDRKRPGETVAEQQQREAKRPHVDPSEVDRGTAAPAKG